MKIVLAVIAALLVAPASALAAGPTLTMREVPLHAARSIAAAVPRFNMVGVHWRGAGTVTYRTRDADGRWSSWHTADADTVEGGWHLGDLDWRGSSTAIRFRTVGRVTRLRAYYVWSPPERMLSRRLAIANAPPIIPRLSWGADEAIRRAAPQYADATHFAVVHHTAGSNTYTRAQSAAIVRGIEIYHVKGNGWNDIGYNLLVDKYGQVFEGRFGGVDRPVIGAHAEGFNTGSVGVAVIGEYGSTQISQAAKSALEQVLAWRLDLAHVDPLSLLSWRSSGNPRFPSGVPVTLRAISGHRDTGFTDCPGDALYAQLPQIAKDVAALGGPKIYAPLAAQAGEGQTRLTAKLSTAVPWTVTITSSTGEQVAQGTGTGSRVDWTWDASTAPPDRYTWTIAATGARPATGVLGATAALALQKTAAQPAAIAPGETTAISYTLTVPATVTATLVSPAGVVLSNLLTAAKPAGSQTLQFTPPPGLLNGLYSIALTATAGARTVDATIPFTVDDIVTGMTVTGTTLHFTLTRLPVSLSLQVLRGSQVVAEPAVPTPAIGPQAVTWDSGSSADGTYTIALSVTDDATTFTRSLDVTLDRTPPAVTALSYRNLRFRVSEPATLTLVAGTRRFVRVLHKAATTQFWLKTKPAAYRLIAVDLAGNRTVVRYPR
jgi:hypothetical protein